MKRERTIATFIHGLIALTALILLVAGTPIALWLSVGWPLPSSIPDLQAVGDSLARGPIADSTVVKAVALAGWAAWIRVAVSAVVEVISWTRGLTPPRIAVGGALQQSMRHLVATSALLLSSSSPTPVSAFAAATVPVHLVLEDERPYAESHRPASEAVPPAEGASPADPAATTTRPEPTYIVQRRDTLWGIAERYLGDPFRWREVFELNRGWLQADGRSLTDPNLIDIGWSLTLPSDAVGLPKSVVPPSAPSGPIPEPGTNPPDTTPPMPEPLHEPAASPETPPTPSTTRAAPSPSTIAPESTTEAPTTAVGTPNQHRSDEREQTAQEEDDADLGRMLAPLLGGGLLAASLLVLLNRFRSIRVRNHRVQGSADDATQALEAALRRVADVEGANRLDLALRAFAAGLARQRPTRLPAISAVRLEGSQVDLLLDAPLDAPPRGFVSTGSPRGWNVDPDLSDTDLQALAEGTVAPLPSLVTAGTVDGDPVLIDIETAGILTLTGDPAHVQPLLRRLAAELATSAWTDWLDIITVGTPIADIAGSHRAMHHPEVRTALDILGKVAKHREQELAEAGHSSTWQARIADEDGEGWFPTVLIAAEPLSHEGLERLCSIVGLGGRGVGAIVVGSDPPAGWSLEVRGSEVLLRPHGLVLTLLGLNEGTADGLDRLLTDEIIDDLDDAAVDVAEAASLSTSTSADAPMTDRGPYVDPPFEVEIRVLGSVEISGGIEITRPKNLEIATYLALHPEGVSDDKLKTLFWPGGKPSRATFNTTVSMTRSALGQDARGEPRLPHFSTTKQRYRLADTVTTDLARFEARWAHARQSSPHRAIETLREALDLVRGQPFDVGRGFEWAFAEGIATRAAISIAEAAHHLAQLAVEDGDLDLANWAALRGLQAAPGDEALYRDRMRAADRAGNVSAVKRIMTELCDIVEVSEPYDQLHPDTIRLYKQIIQAAAGEGMNGHHD